MPESLDDLDALRTIVTALSELERADQERILRWARERLGLSAAPPAPAPHSQATESVTASSPEQAAMPAGGGTRDIKAFVSEKAPSSDNQFAAAVAYYYRFEAPESERKTAITGADLQDAARLAGWSRFNRPNDTLNNALKGGLLDKGSERGTFCLNAVGENLVAMTLPSGTNEGTGRARVRRASKGAKKTTARKATKKSPAKRRK